MIVMMENQQQDISCFSKWLLHMVVVVVRRDFGPVQVAGRVKL